jgi:predicted HD phosphohydrolase
MARADELIRLLYLSAETSDGNPDRSHITNLEHNLRVATLARRHASEDTELIFMALVHDLARPLSDPYHGEVIAEIVRDMVGYENYHVLRTHGQYQAELIHGSEVSPTLSGVSWHRAAQRLCAWEVASFDKNWSLPTMTLDEAEEIIQAICKGRE